MARRFTAVLARLGTPTGDGRILSPGGLSARDLPLPLSWQRESGEGHGGSVVVGRFDTIEFHEDMVTATGALLDEGEYSGVVELLENQVIGPSVDLDDMTYVVDENDRIVITSARVAGATLVAIPAFADVSLTLAPRPAPVSDSGELNDAVYGTEAGDPEYAYYALTQADLATFSATNVSRETLPPMEAFTRPAEVGPVTVSRETWGQRVSGYIATWGSCHIGLPGCTTAPSSRTEYAHFLRKDQPTSDGQTIPVGVLSVGGGHADTKLGLVPALSHYDDVATATAKVFAAEDEHGIWVSGWVLPYADPVRVQQLSDLDLSGDWRKSGGNLELIAICAVNTPGFPVLRKVHFSLERGGQTTLIGQFGIDVSRETSQADPGPDTEKARAAWARAQWNSKGQ